MSAFERASLLCPGCGGTLLDLYGQARHNKSNPENAAHAVHYERLRVFGLERVLRPASGSCIPTKSPRQSGSGA